MPFRLAKQRKWDTLLSRYSTGLVSLAEHSRGEAMLALAQQEAALAAEAHAAMTRAEEENRAKDEFLAHISHELRTPLNAIIGFSDMIRDELEAAEGSGKILDYVRDINSSGWHLSRVINDILDYAKFEAGKLLLQNDPVEFVNALQSCYTMVKGRMEERRITFVRRLAEPLPAIEVDELKLKQILINLLSNAVKFTPEGGTITVEAAVAEAGRFVIRVRDTGVGIPAEDIPKVFLPFHQLNSKLSRKYEGTGLGLPLTRAFVELHGGAIEIDSAPGVGTTVSVLFPAERVLPARGASADGQHPTEISAGKAA